MAKLVSLLIALAMVALLPAQQNCVIVPHPNNHWIWLNTGTINNPINTLSATNLPCWGRRDWMVKNEHENAHEMCKLSNGYITVFEDNFNGAEIDRTKWMATGEENWLKNGKKDHQLFTTFDKTPSNYEVSNGTLKLKVLDKVNGGTYYYPEYDNSNCTLVQKEYEHNYTSGQIKSRKLFTHGMLEVRCKIPYKGDHFNYAPLWLLHPGGQDKDNITSYYEEIDIEFWDHGTGIGSGTTEFNSPSWTYIHKPPPSDQSEANCGDGKNNHCIAVSLYNKWITMRIYWDEWRIRWEVDGRTFRTIYRTYSLSNTPISECTGPKFTGYKYRNDMFPSFSNMFLLACVSANPDHLDGDEILEIDYIKVFKKIRCYESLHIDSYKPHAHRHISEPPTEEHNTPQTLTSGTITVSGNGQKVEVQRDPSMFWTPARLDLYASTSITLNPGFSCDPKKNIDMLWSCPNDTDKKNRLINTVLYGDGFYAEAVECPFPFPTFGKEASEEEDLEEEDFTEVDIPADTATVILDNGGNEILMYPFIECQPNPLRQGNKLDVYYSIPCETKANILVVDARGNIRLSHNAPRMPMGFYNFTLDDVGFEPGLYNLVLNTDVGNASTRFVVIN